MSATVLWTGGKDSALALHAAVQAGHEVKSLVTFVPKHGMFLAHPLEVIRVQAKALRLAHLALVVEEPYKHGYEQAIGRLKKCGIRTLITGDIALVDGQPHWITECAKAWNVRVLRPLWGADRRVLLKKMLSQGFHVIFSCVKKPFFTAAWAGKLLNREALAELSVLRQKTGLDLCGEQGEFHTLTLDAPLFRRRLELNYRTVFRKSLWHLQIVDCRLKKK